ncbi:hypothetical protein HDV06_005973 [Boothiomyces sp. JEL0866]|nr:hypothetical protein HDV06_005973 [Boothiomyces sp. JEL0866]
MILRNAIKPVKLNPNLIKQWGETKFKQINTDIPFVMMTVKESLSAYNMYKSKDQFDAILNNLLKTNIKTGYTFAKLMMNRHPIHPLLFSVLIQSVAESKPIQLLEPMVSLHLNQQKHTSNTDVRTLKSWIPAVIKQAHQQKQHHVNNKISNFVIKHKLELEQEVMDLLINSLSKKSEYFKLKRLEVEDEFNLKYQLIMLLCRFRNKMASAYHLINLFNDLESDFNEKYFSISNSRVLKYKQNQLNSILFAESSNLNLNPKLADYFSRKAKLDECFERLLEYLLYRLDDEFAFEKLIENRKLTKHQSCIVLKYFCKHKNIELIQKYYQQTDDNTKIYFRYLLQNGLASRAKDILGSTMDKSLKDELLYEYNMHQGQYYYNNDLQKRKLFRYFYRNQLYPQLIQLCSNPELETKQPIKEMTMKDYAKLIDAVSIVRKDYLTVMKIVNDNNFDKSDFSQLLTKHFKTNLVRSN